MTSPMTAPILASQRANQRWSRYFCAISAPNVIFTARVNQATFPGDSVAQLIWDGGTGTYGNVKVGMTCLVGSTAGARDIAVLRVRKPLTATVTYFGRVSGVAFADNQYLTFTDEFGLWAKEPVMSGSALLLDEDIAYFFTASGVGMLDLGPLAFVLELTGATVALTRPAPGWYSPIGATVNSYLWTASTGVTVTNGTTSTPTFTIAAAGEYVFYCQVTDSNGTTSTASRRIFVNPASVAVSAPDASGDVDSAGFTCRVEGYGGVGLTELRDRAFVVIWRKDYLGTARDTSYGPYAGATNIRFAGWLDAESLTVNPDFGTAEFTLGGPAHWLGKIPGAGIELTNTSAAAAGWNEFSGLTTDVVIHRLARLYSTLAEIATVTVTGDTTQQTTLLVNSGDLLSQINGIAEEKLYARICFDEFGCGHVTVRPSLRTAAAKSANEILLDLTSADWTGELDIERVTSQVSAQVELGGFLAGGTALYSRAPGNTLSRYGSVDAPASNLATASQAALNQLAGDVLALANNEYPSTALELAWSNDYAGYAMARGWLVRLSVAAADNPRGITWTTKRFAIEAVSYIHASETAASGTGLELAAETTGTAGVTYYPPSENLDGDFSGPPLPNNSDVPGTSTWFPAVIPPTVVNSGATCALSDPNSFAMVFEPNPVSGLDTVTSSYCFFPCKIRDDGTTTITFRLTTYGDAGSNVAFYAVSNDAARTRLLSGVAVADYNAAASLEQNWIVTFTAGAGGLDVSGFEIALAPGGGIGAWELGTVVSTGSANGNDAAGTDVAVTPGQYYSIEGTAGPWKNVGLAIDFYNFGRGPGIVEGGVGAIVWNGERPPLTSTMYLDILTGCIYTEAVSGIYGRTYFLADGTGIFNFCCRDTLFADNFGSLGYILRNAIPIGDRKILVNRAQLNNVCATG